MGFGLNDSYKNKIKSCLLFELPASHTKSSGFKPGYYLQSRQAFFFRVTYEV